MKCEVEIDEELLRDIQRVLGTKGLEDTIEEEAFREVLRMEARREEVHALSRMEGMDLGDSAVMSGSWR